MVAPKLVGAIQAEAAHVAFGTYDYATACCEVMVIACLHGGGRLCGRCFLDLWEWVGEQLSSVLDQELAP